MGRTLASMANQRVPNEKGLLYCLGCGLQPYTSFTPIVPYADGTPRWKSRCRVCCRALNRRHVQAQSFERIWSYEAPRRAAERMLRENPEVLRSLIERHQAVYLRYLREEREKGIEARRQYIAKRRQARARKKVATSAA